ncbi:LLM class oxidoreductase [Aureimonas mangrovi]|uniref:LLM class oxidoreductase n=1 Tax=Aureimonas mangrovi TaxID=2758041 RepID=UPI00163DAFA9|nr:LLM class oxidoreductase [Aureimonas mangrovi]
MSRDILDTHPGFAKVFQPGRLTLGFMMPLARLENGVPDMTGQLELASRVDELGFAALWARDVPFFDPSFGDAGQVYDPWVWLGMLAARTRWITLATAGIVLPLRHPFHTAKAAFTLDAVSNGRFLLGGASGDRPSEFPGFGKDHQTRGANYREAVETIRGVAASFPDISGSFGKVAGLDMLPKPRFGRLPMVAVGSAQQSVQWIAEHMDGWMTYPRDPADQRKRLDLWSIALAERASGAFKPFGQPLFIDLAEDADAPPTPIFLGFRLGSNALVDHLKSLESLGVSHVALQLLFNRRPPHDTIEELASEVLPLFPS